MTASLVRARCFLACAAAVWLAACGGGGGSPEPSAAQRDGAEPQQPDIAVEDGPNHPIRVRVSGLPSQHDVKLELNTEFRDPYQGEIGGLLGAQDRIAAQPGSRLERDHAMFSASAEQQSITMKFVGGGTGSDLFQLGPRGVRHTGNYRLDVVASPPGWVCSVADGGIGFAVHQDPAPVNVVCSSKFDFIAGTVSGLAPGESVTLLNNHADPLPVKASATGQDVRYRFDRPVARAGRYAVTVLASPAGKVCSPTPGARGGPLQGPVVDAGIVCSKQRYGIHGQVHGLEPTESIALILDDSHALRLAGNRAFSLPQAVAAGGDFSLTVSEPLGKTCAVLPGAQPGQGVHAEVVNLLVHCVKRVTDAPAAGHANTGAAG